MNLQIELGEASSFGDLRVEEEVGGPFYAPAAYIANCGDETQVWSVFLSSTSPQYSHGGPSEVWPE